MTGRIVRMIRRAGDEHDGPFDALVRIDTGVVRPGMRVRVRV